VHRQLRCAGIEPAQPLLQYLQLRRFDQVGLGDQQAVGEAHLLLCQALRVELLRGMQGVDHGEHGIQQILARHVQVHEERLRHGSRVGQACGLDEDALEGNLPGAPLSRQLAEDAHEVAANRAADAAVVHHHDLLVAFLQQDLVVDALLAELVLDDRDAPAVVLREDAPDQGGLAAAQEAGEDGHRDARLHARLRSSAAAAVGGGPAPAAVLAGCDQVSVPPRVSTYTAYSDVLPAMNRRLRLVPPKHKLPMISGMRI
jgi:hypothetical protein